MKKTIIFVLASAITLMAVKNVYSTNISANQKTVLSLYSNFLKDIYHNPQNYYDMVKYVHTGEINKNDIEDNKFTLYDIDNEGIDELIISFTNTYSAAMYTGIWKADIKNNTVNEYAVLGVDSTFYSNGIVKINNSHNHTRGYSVWPFSIYKYDKTDKEYKRILYSYCVDSDMDVYREEYSEELDSDQDGTIYYIFDQNNNKKALTLDEYNLIINQYINDNLLLEFEWKKLTLDNIETINPD